MVEIQIVYRGQLRCQATHGPSGVQLLTDAPRDNMGQGASFSPTDLVATALGTCMLTVMGITAQQMQIDLGAAIVIVHKEMTAAPPRRIEKLSVYLNVPAKLDEDKREKLEKAALGCPVIRSLHPDILKPVKFAWA